ncbi:MAG: hypothetical protein V1755_00650, partial [Chloroflexota bacterium]
MDNMHRSVPVLPSEITPQSLYRNRRDFLKATGILGGSALLAACAPAAAGAPGPAPTSAAAFGGQT